MLDGMHDDAHFRSDRADDHFDDADALPSSGSLDDLLAELISQAPEISLSSITPAFDNPSAGSNDAVFPEAMIVEAVRTGSVLADATVGEPLAAVTPKRTEPVAIDVADTALPEEPEPVSQVTAEPMPVRVYSISDLMLFERLTSYRLVAQRQLWRSVDKEGNRATAGDRLFTVLAEEAFQLADRQRRNGPSPHADLTVRDIAEAMKPMRAIAAHLGERGHQAADRLEAVLTAALNWHRRAA
ncbi:hypothetical protein [Neorhizobium sp. JUb45]|uniref:hypothetical protein n=1 Tax=unclassified Neorhizobium TaxID=2629175 RepID=UPI0010439828|nr:hypothetical protein [Neorhizobium sp. JUb45]TCR00109.1 hypothetical protein EDF70_107186 [Neorhizobium sp. JUb45]